MPDPVVGSLERRFAMCLGLALAGLLLIGAREVTRELNQRSSQLQAMSADLSEWGALLLQETRISPTGEPTRATAEEAMLLVEASSTFLPGAR